MSSSTRAIKSDNDITIINYDELLTRSGWKVSKNSVGFTFTISKGKLFIDDGCNVSNYIVVNIKDLNGFIQALLEVKNSTQ